MRTIKSKSGTEIKIFSSSKELTIERYSEFQKHLLTASSTEDFNLKLNRIKAFIEENQIKESLIELNNAISCLNAVISGVGIYTYAFAVLVAEIGGKPLNDITDDGLLATINLLKSLELTIDDIEQEIISVKKKSNLN